MFEKTPPTRSLTDEQRIDWLRLIRSTNVGPTTFRQLLNRFGTAHNALDALPELTRRGGAKSIPAIATRDQAIAELEELDRMGARMVALGEPDYPVLLAHIHAPPPLLAIYGSMARNTPETIGIVGARNASAAGRKLCATIAAELGQAGYVIASGLARGIDTTAHAATLETGTIAFFAGGLDQVYPPENTALASAIVDAGGALISEMPLGTLPRARDFPRRNRLVSGASRGVLVVEAAQRSGSLITARMALEQNREVFAVPGFPLDPRAKGTNSLIRQGACLVTCAADLIAELQTRHSPADLFREEAPGPLEEMEQAELPHASASTDPAEDERQRVADALSTTPLPIDDLIAATGLPASLVQTILLEMDLAGRIERSAGQLVALT